MERAKETLEPSFDKTCELIYKLASARISQKYDEWKKGQSYGRAIIGFCSTNRKVLGYVLKCKRQPVPADS